MFEPACNLFQPIASSHRPIPLRRRSARLPTTYSLSPAVENKTTAAYEQSHRSLEAGNEKSR